MSRHYGMTNLDVTRMRWMDIESFIFTFVLLSRRRLEA